MPQRPRFLFLTCQVGAERAVKAELARQWPDFRFAFSRPGLLTFKLPDEHGLLADFDLKSVFARTYGFSLGKAQGDNPDDLAQQVWQLFGGRPFRRIHAWARDAAEPGHRDFEPSITPAAVEAHQALHRHCPRPESLAPGGDDPLHPAEPGEFVLDCILVEPDQWWVGYHRARSGPSTWPGGILCLELPEQAVSRAWLKMEEALRWSELPIEEGARCAEIGSAPGGASQALLERGLHVTGIDPAQMHADVLAHPQFTHIRHRVPQVRRREFRKIRWIAADMSVAPSYTLDAVEGIVTHTEVNVRGLLLTLKLLDWKLADEIPQFIERVKGWGYNMVRAKQLSHHRQEFCIAALQQPFHRKPPSRPKRP